MGRTTYRQKLVIGELLANRGKPISMKAILLNAGYSEAQAKNPKQVLESKGFLELLEAEMPDHLLLKTHKALLTSTKVEHMVFPLWKDPEDDIPEEGDLPEHLEPQGHGGALKRRKKVTEGSGLTDNDIVELLASVNCTVKKIVHGEMARHVYYWTANTKAQQDALKLAYDVKGRLASKEPKGDQYNTFIQQNNINPNTPSARKLVDATLQTLMDQTKRQPVLDVKAEQTS